MLHVSLLLPEYLDTQQSHLPFPQLLPHTSPRGSPPNLTKIPLALP